MLKQWEDTTDTASRLVLQMVEWLTSHPHSQNGGHTLLGKCLAAISYLIVNPEEEFMGRTGEQWIRSATRFKAVLKNSEHKRTEPRAIVLTTPLLAIMACSVEGKSELALTRDLRALIKESPAERLLSLPVQGGVDRYQNMDGTKFNETQSPEDLEMIFEWAMGPILGKTLTFVFKNEKVIWQDYPQRQEDGKFRRPWRSEMSHYGMLMGMFNYGATLKTLGGLSKEMAGDGVPVFMFSDDAVSTRPCARQLHDVAFNISTKKSHESPHPEINSFKAVHTAKAGTVMAEGFGQLGGGLKAALGPIGTTLSAAGSLWMMMQLGLSQDEVPDWEEIQGAIRARFLSTSGKQLFMPDVPEEHKAHVPPEAGGTAELSLMDVVRGEWAGDCDTCQLYMQYLIEGQDITSKPFAGARRVTQPRHEGDALNSFLMSKKGRKRPGDEPSYMKAAKILQTNVMFWEDGPISKIEGQLAIRQLPFKVV
uniref:Uncharacterized protein n=1 Tax=Takifugu rubripes RNA virus TaxID=2652723 RepID=A0A6J4AHJ8_9VIRU|nr:hypothetical protein [Takifugu rubripes RNA virus]